VNTNLETLIFRFPGEEIQQRRGSFNRIAPNSELSGFVVSDFNLGCLYSFVPYSGNFETPWEKLFFQSNTPKVMNKLEYLAISETILTELKQEKLQKVVFSRIKNVGFEASKAYQLFLELEKEYPHALVYLVSSELFGTWIGATPEILIDLQGKEARTMSLAGTKKTDDAALWNKKEIDEQQYVTDFILDKLQQGGFKDLQCSIPATHIAGPVKHLRSDITFEMGENSIRQVIELLHPTPAVSGFPQKEALKCIAESEKSERELYTGIIGWVSPESSKLYVNLRCCQINKGEAFLYLGGGFTKESSPELEWEETENKSKTILNILQKIEQ
jgi:isochorismate synthase